MTLEKQDIRGTLIGALAQSPMLQYLGRYGSRGEDLREMLTSGEVHHFPAGHSIITQGDESDAMYLLADGAVAIFLDGAEVCVLDQPGEVFGEFGAITGELRTASVTAQTDVTCLAVRTGLDSGQDPTRNSSFYRALQQAFARILLVRLQQSNEDRVRLKSKLAAAENQASFLRSDNEMLVEELKAARAEIRGLRNESEGSAGAATTC